VAGIDDGHRVVAVVVDPELAAAGIGPHVEHPFSGRQGGLHLPAPRVVDHDPVVGPVADEDPARVAWAAYLSSAWALLGPVMFVLYMNRFQIAPEEKVLASLFGSSYAEYRSKVQRWI
jgi:hypothetical protein